MLLFIIVKSSRQDTIYAHSLRRFFPECKIQATINFIFGNAAAIFHNFKVNGRATFLSALQITRGSLCTFQALLTHSICSNTIGSLMFEQIIQYIKIRPGPNFS